MIEVIYKEEKQDAKGNEGMFAVPRNIRQIGIPGEGYRIYVEDYVYTFLVRLAGMETKGEKGHLAVLTGEAKWQSGVTYIFVRGAVIVDKAEAAADHIDFTTEVWTKIHDEQGLYFPGQEIVGWFFAQQELPLEVSETFKRVHLKHFGGGDKVLMLMDPAEREDAFFRYENSFLIREPGYYLFYEQNPLMQNYMLDKNQEVIPEKTEDISDDAVIAFRRIIRAKKKPKKVKKEEKPENVEAVDQEQGTSVFSYAATACLALAVLVAGVNFYQDYQGGYGIEKEAETASASIDGESVDKVQEGEGSAAAKETILTITPTAVMEKSLGQERKATTNGTGQENSMTGQETVEEQADNVTEENTGGQTNGVTEESTDEQVNRTAGQVSGTEQQTSTSGQSTEETQIYQEESDIRKARRKQALAEQEAANTQEDTETAETVSSQSAHTSYVIRPGDTLYQISIEKYGSMNAIAEICELNGISPEEIIYPGQIIVLP